MRSVEPGLRFALAVVLTAALCGGVSGCASVGEQVAMLSQTLVSAVSEAVSPTAEKAEQAEKLEKVEAPTTRALALAPVAAPEAPLPPLDPLVARAYDDALRHLRNGRTDEATKAFQVLVQTHPELGGPHANLGVIHQRAGRLPEAAAALEHAVAASPRQPAYANQLGIVYREQGQFNKAREAYEKALALDPEHAGATLNLGILYDLYLWEPQKALVQYEKYLALHKDAAVTKWAADLKNQSRKAATTAAVKGKDTDKEKP